MSRSNNPYLISLVSTICDAKLDLVGEMLSNSHTVLQQCLERNILGLFIDWVVSDIRHEIKQIPGNHVRAEPNLNIKVPPVLCSLVPLKRRKRGGWRFFLDMQYQTQKKELTYYFANFSQTTWKLQKYEWRGAKHSLCLQNLLLEDGISFQVFMFTYVYLGFNFYSFHINNKISSAKVNMNNYFLMNTCKERQYFPAQRIFILGHFITLNRKLFYHECFITPFLY